MSKSACFTGHRNITSDMNELSAVLYKVLEELIVNQNITDYYAGGAYGFDAVASNTVLNLRKKYPEVRLHLVLPCSNAEQTKKWSAVQKQELNNFLYLANSVEYITNKYYNGCMKDRNARLVELASERCICYWNVNYKRSGTRQTVRMAQNKGIEVMNLFDISNFAHSLMFQLD